MKMNRLPGALVLLVLMGGAATVEAAQCRVNGGPWLQVDAGGTLTLEVPVTVRPSADVTRILLEGVRLECRFTPNPNVPISFTDHWATSALAGAPWTPGPKF